MDNTIISITKHIMGNLAAFGLAAVSDLKLIEKPKSSLEDGGRLLILQALRTLPDNTFGVPFNNLLAPGVKGERFLTLIEFECKTRAPDPSIDFYWNDARKFRDAVFEALAGPNRAGLVIPRYDWADQQNPAPAGKIWFECDPGRNSPMEDPVEDPNDAASKSIFLTYSCHWWRPVA